MIQPSAPGAPGRRSSASGSGGPHAPAGHARPADPPARAARDARQRPHTPAAASSRATQSNLHRTAPSAGRASARRGVRDSWRPRASTRRPRRAKPPTRRARTQVLRHRPRPATGPASRRDRSEQPHVDASRRIGQGPLHHAREPLARVGQIALVEVAEREPHLAATVVAPRRTRCPAHTRPSPPWRPARSESTSRPARAPPRPR